VGTSQAWRNTAFLAQVASFHQADENETIAHELTDDDTSDPAKGVGTLASVEV
jgi:hypothetical protein